MTDWIEAFLASEDGQQAVQDGDQLVIPSGLLKTFLKGQGMDCSPTGLGRLYEEAGAVRSGRRLNGKMTKVVLLPVSVSGNGLHAESKGGETKGGEVVASETKTIETEAPATERTETKRVETKAAEAVVVETKAAETKTPLSSPAGDEKTDASEVLPAVSDAPVSDAVVLSSADQALVEQHGLEQVMGPHRTLIWSAPMNASRAARMAAVRLNNPDLFAEESSTPTGGTAAAVAQESEVGDASSKTARVLLPGGEVIELRDGLAPVSVLEHLPPGTELEGDKPCRIKGRDGVWHLHATRARKDGNGIDALVLSPDRSGVLTADLFGEVELIEKPDDGHQVKVIGNDGQVIDPVTGEGEGVQAPGKTQAGRDLLQMEEVAETPSSTPATVSPVALKGIDPAVLKRLPGDAKREGDVLCVVPGHPEQWKLHATRCRPGGGVNALLVSCADSSRVVVVDRDAVELLPAAPAKAARKKVAATPEDQLDRAAAKLAKKFKGEVVKEAVAA